MILVLFGENDFLIESELKRIIQQYRSKHKSGLSFFVFDEDNFDFKHFDTAVFSASMFEEKKCIIVKNLFFNNKDKFLNYIKSHNLFNDKDRVLIFIENNPDKADKKFKELIKKPALSYEFNNLNNKKMHLWCLRYLKNQGVTITQDALNFILLSDSLKLRDVVSELDKLSLISNKIDLNLVLSHSFLAKKISQDKIFEFLDKLFSQRKKEAFLMLDLFLKSGSSISYIVSMINFQLSNLLLVNACIKNGIKGKAEISKNVGLSPFVVVKSLNILKFLPEKKIKLLLDKLFDLDLKIKSSRLDAKSLLEIYLAQI